MLIERPRLPLASLIIKSIYSGRETCALLIRCVFKHSLCLSPSNKTARSHFLHSYTLHFQIYFTCFPEKAPGVPDPPFCKQKIYCGYVNKQKQIQEIPFRVTGKTCDVLTKVGFI